MGQFVHVFRESGFLDAWTRASGKDLNGIRVIDLDKLTQLRNKLIHKGREATRSEAEFLFNCLHVIIETFEIEGRGTAAPEEAVPSARPQMPEREPLTEELRIPGKRYAILVGPQYAPEEQDLEPLQCTGSDVGTLRRLLKHENIGGFHEALLLKGKIPGYQLAKEMQKMFAQTAQGDLILLYFSGHAGIDAGYGWYFLDSETGADMFSMSPLSLENIKRQFIMRYQADHIVIILDCLYHTEDTTPLRKEMVENAFGVLSDVSADKQIAIISSLANTVEEKEGPNAWSSHSTGDRGAGDRSGRFQEMWTDDPE